LRQTAGRVKGGVDQQSEPLTRFAVCLFSFGEGEARSVDYGLFFAVSLSPHLARPRRSFRGSSTAYDTPVSLDATFGFWVILSK
jgi:hypothetical protein